MISRFDVMNLDRQPERWQFFCRVNSESQNLHRVPAVDGKDVNRDALIEKNIIKPDNVYTAGALGCALSHINFWHRVVQSNLPGTILEDDAVLRPDFEASVNATIQSSRGWDIILWGWNPDWPALIQPAAGLPPMLLRSQTHTPTFDTDQFKEARGPVQLMRLYSAAGLLCYSVSPTGARKLLDLCLPIGNERAVYVQEPDKYWANTGIDVELARHYPQLAAYCSFPPLAFSHNDWNSSAIRPNAQNLKSGMA